MKKNFCKFFPTLIFTVVIFCSCEEDIIPEGTDLSGWWVSEEFSIDGNPGFYIKFEVDETSSNVINLSFNHENSSIALTGIAAIEKGKFSYEKSFPNFSCNDEIGYARITGTFHTSTTADGGWTVSNMIPGSFILCGNMSGTWRVK